MDTKDGVISLRIYRSLDTVKKDTSMRIKRLRAWQPVCESAPQDWRSLLGQILVEIELSTGTIGLGVGGGGISGIHVIDSVISECVLNNSYDSPAEAHAAMVTHTSFYGRKGIVPMAISGVDLAIWDAFAKEQKLSVFELLSDQQPPDFLPMYQTVFDDREASAAVADGKQAVKLHVERYGDKPDPADIRSLVKATRDKLGAGKSIMIDAFGRWNVETTLEIASAIVEFDIEWIEEPVGPEALDAYSFLNAKSPIPIAGGEHEYLKEGFEDLAARQAVSVFQPDINWCGGLTTLIDIYRVAADYGVRVVPHRGSEPYSLPAIAALDSEPLAESARSWFTAIDGIPEPTRDGVKLNDGAGFGVSVAGDS